MTLFDHRFPASPIRSAALLFIAATLLRPGAYALPPQALDTVHSAALPAATWVQAAADNEVRIIDEDSFPLRYRVHKIDSKGDVVREVIDARDGSVARTIQRDGKPLTQEQDKAERDRLEEILADPTEFFKHQKRNGSARSYASSLVKLIPTAMLYTYTPGQPQPANAPGPQVVVDFKPDPNFQPPTMTAQLLTGLEGRLWIDRRTQRLTRVEGRVVKPVNFGWGVLAHVYPGGTIEFEQAEVAPGHWIYSHVDENITIREMMLHTITEKQQMTARDAHPMPASLGYRDAIHLLLEMQIPLR